MPYFKLPIHVGLVDGPDDANVPPGACVETLGFEFRRGYPHAEYGREKKTASEMVSTQRVRALANWQRISGTSYKIAMCGGRMLTEATADGYAFTTLLNTVVTGATTATLANGTAVTTSGVRLQETIYAGTGTDAPGDYFYFNADGIAYATQIKACSTTSATLAAAYSGTATSGAFTIWRKFSGTDVTLVPAGGRLFIFDGVKRPHWYGKHTGLESGTDVFRECGLPVPGTAPTVAISGTTGGLSATSDYWWGVCFEDAYGNISNPVKTLTVTSGTTGTQAASMTDFPAAPKWVTRYRIYRSRKNTPDAYSIVKDLNYLQLSAISAYNSTADTTLLTLHASARALTVNAHKQRYCTFDTSSSAYRITANSSTTVTVSGNAASESTTDYVSIAGGFDYTQVYASGYTDVSPDTDLDYTNQCPSENTQPPLGLKYGHLFRGGGTLCAYQDGVGTDVKTHSLVWFSGRSTGAPLQSAVSTDGENELDYWPYSYDAGLDKNRIMGFCDIGQATFAVKETGIQKLYQDSRSRDDWFWYPVRGTEGIGALASKTFITKEGLVYFLGHDGQQLDVILFDGRKAFGMFRLHDSQTKTSRLRRILDDFVSYPAQATATMFQGRIWLSFPGTSGATTNTRTLRYDVKTRAVDVQPWGCGVFCEPYKDSSNNHILLCGAPSDLGDVYRVLGTAADLGSSIVRKLTFPVSVQEPVILTRFVDVLFRVRLDSATPAATPTIEQSTDGLDFEDAGKSWSTMEGDTWPTTKGLHTVHRQFKNHDSAELAHVRLSSTDADDYSILSITVVHQPVQQLQDR